MFLAQAAEAAAAKAIIESTDFLAGKDAKWFFIAVLIILGIGTLLGLRWLLKSHEKYITSMETQLTEQRAANRELNEKLFTYMINDHQKAVESQNTMAASMRELAQAIKELSLRQRD